MAFLMSAVEVAAPTGVWEWFLFDVFGFIANFGWRVVVFVVLLKLVLSPLDFYQRYKMRKNQRITEALKPQMEKLEKQYGADKQTLQQKQMELNKKAGFSYMSACLPLIITLVLFITFYTALRNVSVYMEFKEYVEMYDAYVTAYDETGFDYISRINDEFAIDSELPSQAKCDEIDAWLKGVFESEETLAATISSEAIQQRLREAFINEPTVTLGKYKTEYIDKGKTYKDFLLDYKDVSSTDKLGNAIGILMQIKAQDAAVEAFENSRTSFLWIKSLWVADVPWKNSMPNWADFQRSMSSIGSVNYLDRNSNPGKVYATDEQKPLFDDMVGGKAGWNNNNYTYDIVTAKLRENDDLYKTNGYLVLVILVVGLSLLSQFISNMQQKKSGQIAQGGGMGMMKVMLFMMPILLAVFALTSSSAFTLYMVTNSLMSLAINFITSLIVNAIFGGKTKETVIKHGRLDPNDRINKK